MSYPVSRSFQSSTPSIPTPKKAPPAAKQSQAILFGQTDTVTFGTRKDKSQGRLDKLDKQRKKEGRATTANLDTEKTKEEKDKIERERKAKAIRDAVSAGKR